MERCCILSARKYAFKDGEKDIEGANITYVTGEPESTSDYRGLAPLTISGGTEIFGQLSVVPGVYDLEFKQRPGQHGKPTLKVVGINYVMPVDLGCFDVA